MAFRYSILRTDRSIDVQPTTTTSNSIQSPTPILLVDVSCWYFVQIKILSI